MLQLKNIFSEIYQRKSKKKRIETFQIGKNYAHSVLNKNEKKISHLNNRFIHFFSEMIYI